MSQKKRKYGEIRKGAETAAGTNDEVFSRFFTDTPSPAPENASEKALGTTRLNSTQVDSTQLDSTHIKTPSSEGLNKPIAPEKDFNRRANSLDRDALPRGMFPGTSKKLYDALYLRTRGAINPVRSIQATRSEVMRWAGIGGLNTFLSHIKHLTNIGLIVRHFEIGNKEGAIYEVRIPEELDSTQLDSTQLNSTPNRVHDSTQNLMRVESSNPVENKDTYGFPKTSFKTSTERTDDDEAAPVLRALKKMVEEITGREATRGEYNKLVELIEVLTLEGKIASGRTTVSSVGPFLAEHLRRRLFKKNKQELAVEATSASNEQPTPSLNIKQCPDCHGTSMYYPDGYEKGVAKCRHQRLLEQPTEFSTSTDSDAPDKASDVPSTS